MRLQIINILQLKDKPENCRDTVRRDASVRSVPSSFLYHLFIKSFIQAPLTTGLLSLPVRLQMQTTWGLLLNHASCAVITEPASTMPENTIRYGQTAFLPKR